MTQMCLKQLLTMLFSNQLKSLFLGPHIEMLSQGHCSKNFVFRAKAYFEVSNLTHVMRFVFSINRTFKQADVPTSVSRVAPDFCTIYVIAKGKISSIRPGKNVNKQTTSSSVGLVNESRSAKSA